MKQYLPDEKDERVIMWFLIGDGILTLLIAGFVVLTLL